MPFLQSESNEFLVELSGILQRLDKNKITVLSHISLMQYLSLKQNLKNQTKLYGLIDIIKPLSKEQTEQMVLAQFNGQTKNQQMSFYELKELYEQSSDRFEQALEKFTIQVYYEIQKGFQNKCKIQELSRREGFVNYEVNVGGHTCYISQVKAGYVAPGEIFENAHGHPHVTANLNNNREVNAAIVEGLCGKEIEEAIRHFGNDITLVSNISPRSTRIFGLDPEQIFNAQDRLVLLSNLIEGI